MGKKMTTKGLPHDKLYRNKEWLARRKRIFKGKKQQGFPRISDMQRYKPKKGEETKCGT